MIVSVKEGEPRDGGEEPGKENQDLSHLSTLLTAVSGISLPLLSTVAVLQCHAGEEEKEARCLSHHLQLAPRVATRLVLTVSSFPSLGLDVVFREPSGALSPSTLFPLLALFFSIAQIIQL